MKVKRSGICKMCSESCDFVESHIMPSGLTKQSYKKSDGTIDDVTLVIFDEGGVAKINTTQFNSGANKMADYIFCKPCEKKFQLMDNALARFINDYNPSETPDLPKKPDLKLLTVAFTSILYRCSMVTNIDLKQHIGIDLGNYYNGIAKDMIEKYNNNNLDISSELKIFSIEELKVTDRDPNLFLAYTFPRQKTSTDWINYFYFYLPKNLVAVIRMSAKENTYAKRWYEAMPTIAPEHKELFKNFSLEQLMELVYHFTGRYIIKVKDKSKDKFSSDIKETLKQAFLSGNSEVMRYLEKNKISPREKT